MTLLALLGLAIAANATDGTMTWVGLFLCAFGVLFSYGMIARYSGGSGGSGKS
jgi:hypothetical protein